LFEVSPPQHQKLIADAVVPCLKRMKRPMQKKWEASLVASSSAFSSAFSSERQDGPASRALYSNGLVLVPPQPPHAGQEHGASNVSLSPSHDMHQFAQQQEMYQQQLQRRQQQLQPQPQSQPQSQPQQYQQHRIVLLNPQTGAPNAVAAAAAPYAPQPFYAPQQMVQVQRNPHHHQGAPSAGMLFSHAQPQMADGRAGVAPPGASNQYVYLGAGAYPGMGIPVHQLGAAPQYAAPQAFAFAAHAQQQVQVQHQQHQQQHQQQQAQQRQPLPPHLYGQPGNRH
jgi:hypothetical protein